MRDLIQRLRESAKPSKTWKELEAEGVKRCCASFRGGGRCRRRAVANGFCAKHQWVHDKAHALNKAALDALKNYKRPSDEDDED